jgi:hypothetical protein
MGKCSKQSSPFRSEIEQEESDRQVGTSTPARSRYIGRFGKEQPCPECRMAALSRMCPVC